MPERAVILIVEDNELDRVFIRRAFAKARVLNPLFEAATGEEAISYLNGEGRYANRSEYPLPELVLLDLKLNGITGFQVQMDSPTAWTTGSTRRGADRFDGH